ncbi:MAG: hypothetical protein WCA38_14570 [Candidatus Acidiferrales bacterium]
MTEKSTAVKATLFPSSTVEPKSLLDRIHKFHAGIERRAYEIFRGLVPHGWK